MSLKSRARKKRYRQRHPERVKAASRKYHQRQSDELSDTYVKQILIGKRNYGLKYNDLPAELVELKRALITLRRAYKWTTK